MNSGSGGGVLNWFSSHLIGPYVFVSLDPCSSWKHGIQSGLPQGSTLGAVLFNPYKLPLGEVIRRLGISFHCYADDRQIYIAVSADDSGPIDTLWQCIVDIKSWMAENFLQLNPGGKEYESRTLPLWWFQWLSTSNAIRRSNEYVHWESGRLYPLRCHAGCSVSLLCSGHR